MCTVEESSDSSTGVSDGGSFEISYNDASIQKCVSERLRIFYEHNIFTDVTLVAGNVTINAHKLVLAASSAFFEAKFSYEEKIAASEEKLDFDGYLFKNVVDYIYYGRIAINRENVRDLMELQDFFQIASLRSLICHFLQSQIVNTNGVFMDALKLKNAADFYRYEDLSARMFFHLREKFSAILASDEFLDVTHEFILDCLRSDFLVYTDEDELLLGICRWLSADPTRLIYFDELFDKIDPSYVRRWRETEMNSLQIMNGHESLKRWFERHVESRLTSSTGGLSRFKNVQKPALLLIGGISDVANGHPTSTVDCNVTLYENWRPMSPTVDISSPYNQCAKPLPLMHHPRILPRVASDGTNVYVAGGGALSVEVYSSKLNKWTELPELPRNLDLSGGTMAILDGCLYIFTPGQKEPSLEKARFLVLYKDSKTWHNLQAPNIVTRPVHLVSAISSLHLFMSGQTNEEKYVWRYDVSLDLWNIVAVAPLMGYNNICACIAFNHVIYVVVNASVLYSYNTITQTWRQIGTNSSDLSGVSTRHFYNSAKFGSEIVLAGRMNEIIVFGLSGSRSMVLKNRRHFGSIAHVNLCLHSPPPM